LALDKKAVDPWSRWKKPNPSNIIIHIWWFPSSSWFCSYCSGVGQNIATMTKSQEWRGDTGQAGAGWAQGLWVPVLHLFSALWAPKQVPSTGAGE
jgi:hypothetical protein